MASNVDLNNIKTQIKSILDAANTTTASPIDLSNSLTDRIKSVLKVNPERIPIYSGVWPCITMFYGSKNISQADIAINQNNSQRRATIDLNLVGMVFLHQISDPEIDDADNEVENLMENIERILRNNSTLNNAVLWQIPDQTTYHNIQLEEDSFLRTGIMTIKMEVFY